MTWGVHLSVSFFLFFPFHTVHGILKARILKWFAIPFSSGPCFVRTLHHHLGWPYMACLSFTELNKKLWSMWSVLLVFCDCGFHIFTVFPESSIGKESTCIAGDPSLIPGLGRFIYSVNTNYYLIKSKSKMFICLCYGCESWTIKKAERLRIDAFELWWWRRFLNCKEIQPVYTKGNQSWIFIGRTDVEAETPILWPPDVKSWLIWKDPDAGKDWRQEKKGTTEDEVVGWHHWLNGHEFG